MALEPRVATLETTVGKHERAIAEHKTILLGPDGCPDEGMVNKQAADHKKISDIEILITQQTIYNKALTTLAYVIGSAVVVGVVTAVLRLVLK